MRKFLTLFAALSLLLSACGDDDDTANTTDSSATDSSATDSSATDSSATDSSTDEGAAAGAVTVTAADFSFAVEGTAAAGSTVTVTMENADDVAHTFTAESASVDEEVAGGESAEFDVTMPAEGALDFVCRFHPNMTASIEVS